MNKVVESAFKHPVDNRVELPHSAAQLPNRPNTIFFLSCECDLDYVLD